MLLKHLNMSADELLVLENNVKFFDISNREGHASKIYFHNLFGMNFNRENNDQKEK